VVGGEPAACSLSSAAASACSVGQKGPSRLEHEYSAVSARLKRPTSRVARSNAVFACFQTGATLVQHSPELARRLVLI
jgi:hypothetical protein